MRLDLHCVVASEVFCDIPFESLNACFVYVTCTDQSTHISQPIRPVGTVLGEFDVAMDLCGAHLVDTLKFHFLDNAGRFILSSWIGLPECLRSLAAGTPYEAEMSNSRTGSRLRLRVAPRTDPQVMLTEYLHHDPPFGPSCLRDTERANALFLAIGKDVASRLKSDHFIRQAGTGAEAFQTALLMHGMQEQMTLITEFQNDMAPSPALMDRFIDSGLLAYYLADALRFKGMTVEHALIRIDTCLRQGDPTDSSVDFLGELMSSVCQTAQRAAGAVHYTADMTPVPRRAAMFMHSIPGASAHGPNDNNAPDNVILTDYFKRTFAEPFNAPTFVDAENAAEVCIDDDDCEGLAGMELDTVSAFGRLFERFQQPPPPPGEEENAAATTTAPPSHSSSTPLMPMDDEEGTGFINPKLVRGPRSALHMLFQLALKLGRAVSEGRIQCHTIMMSAGAPQMGGKACPDGALCGHVAGLLLVYPKPQPRPRPAYHDEGHALSPEEAAAPASDTAITSRTVEVSDRPAACLILEGTCFAHDDGDGRQVQFRMASGESAFVDMSNVANIVTLFMADAQRGGNNEPASRHEAEDSSRDRSACMHFSHLSPYPIYNTAFVEGDRLLFSKRWISKVNTEAGNGEGEHDIEDTPPFPDPFKPKSVPIPKTFLAHVFQHGVPVKELHDYEVKTLFRIGRKCIRAEEAQWLRQHCRRRAREIHTPLAPLSTIRAYLERRWWPVEVPTDSDADGERQPLNSTKLVHAPSEQGPVCQYIAAVFCTAFRRSNNGEDDAARLRAELTSRRRIIEAVDGWMSGIGEPRVWASMDSIFHAIFIPVHDPGVQIDDSLQEAVERIMRACQTGSRPRV